MRGTAIGFILVGLLTLIVGFFVTKSVSDAQDKVATADAVVVDVFAIKDYDYDDVYYPVVRFNTTDGKTIEAPINAEVNSKAIGKTIAVEYKTYNPYDVVVKPVGVLFLFLAFGLFFLIPGIIIFKASFKEKNAKDSK